jgi:hypothetical protein
MVIHGFLMADLFGTIHQHCFALNSGYLQQKCVACLKQLSVTVHWGENKLLSGI